MTGFDTYSDAAPSAADDARQEAWEKLLEEKEDDIWAAIAKDGGRKFVEDYEDSGAIKDAFEVIQAFVKQAAENAAEKEMGI